MATNTVQAFNQFASNLTLTTTQRKTVADRKVTVGEALERAFPIPGNLSIIQTDLIGSAKRDTMIRPPDDIDLLAIFHPDDWANWRHNSQLFLYKVRDGLYGGRPNVVGSKGQAVRIAYTDGIKVDVAPVFQNIFGNFYLPKGDGTWIPTNPAAHDEYSAQKDRAFDNQFKPFVRKLKAWNRAHSHRLKSFHLEVMAGSLFSSIGNDSRAACELFFRSAEYYLDAEDPSGLSGNLAGGFTYNRRTEIINSFRSAYNRVVEAREAERLGNHAEAIRLWRIIFGDTHFPAYG